MELGSEYNLSFKELNIVKDNIFNYLTEFNRAYYFDSGRSALKHITKQIKHNMKVLLPEFICESVINCFHESQVVFYRVRDDFTIAIDDLEAKIEKKPAIIFLMHYFGALQPGHILSKIRSIADKSGSVIIEDTTHSIFSRKHTIGDYMICSIRKWLPIAGGGVLYFDQNKIGLSEPHYDKSTENTRSYGMVLKELFLSTGFDCNSEYRKIFAESDEKLNEQNEVYTISDLARFIASCTSVEKLKYIRKRNYKLLTNELEKIGVKSAVGISSQDTPLVYPLRIHDRDVLRTHLMDKQIYCAIHWPFDDHKPEQRSFAKRNAKELISLPIDQRYDDVHIRYLIEMLHQYEGDLLF